jgi:general secretion pathway protein L
MELMLASFAAWWIARILELLPASWIHAADGPPDRIDIELNQHHRVTISLRRKGRHEPLTLEEAARLAGRHLVSFRPPPEAILRKQHVVPTAPRRELDQLLRFELARITPFAPEDLFWMWNGRPRTGDKNRTDVTLTMVPRIAVAPALDTLADAGLRPRFIDIGSPDRPRLLAIDDTADHSTGSLFARPVVVRGLAWACASLAALALVLPAGLQERALYATNSRIDALRPAIAQVEALRRDISVNGAEREIVARETERTGDVLQILATVTRILPDDTHLTDFSLRDRQLLLGGRSAAAARLITGLSADPAIRDAAFAAPVTRLEGATTDVFSIRAAVKP